MTYVSRRSICEDGGTSQFALRGYIKHSLLYMIILFYYFLADPVHLVDH